MKHAISMFYTLKKHGFLTNQIARKVLSIFLRKMQNPSRLALLALDYTRPARTKHKRAKIEIFF